MRLRVFLSLAVSLPLSFSIVSSAASIDASAAPTGGHYLTSAEARSIFGESISFTYYNGSEYVDMAASYSRDSTITSVSSNTNFDSVYSGAPCLIYESERAITTNTDISYITVSIQPRYSIIDTEILHTFIGAMTQGTVSDVYQSPSWDWNIGHFENSATTGNGKKAYLYNSDIGYNFTFVPVDYTSSSMFSAYSLDAKFQGNASGNNYYYRFAIGIPYVSGDASAAAGTLPPDSGGGGSSGGDINVNIDLTETNQELSTQTGLINNIISWIGQFFNELSSTVRSWFIPSQDFFENWVDELMDTITDHFLPHLPLNGQIENIASDLAAALGEGGVQAVNFPAVDVPGTDFSMPSYSVPLVPSGMEDSVEYLKLMIDCLCTLWVFNMVLNRIHALIVGESAVEVIDHVD